MQKIRRWLVKILSEKSVSRNIDIIVDIEDVLDNQPIDVDHPLTFSGYGVSDLVLSKGVIRVDADGNIIVALVDNEPKITITSESLQEKGLQEDYVWTFSAHWPDGLVVSENTILEMQEKYIDITEVAKVLFTDKAFNKYKQLINPVKISYDEKVEIAEQVYNKALEPADKIFDEAIDLLDNECDDAIEAAEKEYRKITDGLKDVTNRKIRRAMLSTADKEHDAAIEKAAGVYDTATNKLEEDYNKILGPTGQEQRDSTIEITQLYNRTKAIAFIKSWTLKK